MNTTKKLQQAKLDQWAVLCKEQSQSGLTVRQWCEQNGYMWALQKSCTKSYLIIFLESS